MDNFNEVITSGLLAIVAAVVLWAARGALVSHAFDWLKKLLLFFLIDSIFRSAVALFQLNDLKTFLIYELNVGMFKIIPESSWILLSSLLAFVLSYEMLLWVIGHHHLPGNSKHHSQNSGHGHN
jgi:hypothetical protein